MATTYIFLKDIYLTPAARYALVGDLIAWNPDELNHEFSLYRGETHLVTFHFPQIDLDALVANGFIQTTTQQAEAVVNALSKWAWNEVPSGSIDGNNGTFVLSHVPNSGELQLYVNGMYQSPGIDYSISQNVITLMVIPSTGSPIISNYRYTA